MSFSPRWQAMNEAKKELWTAKELVKNLRAEISETDELPDDAGRRLECAEHALSLLGARLRELEG